MEFLINLHKKHTIILLFLVCSMHLMCAQNTTVFSGKVIDAETNKNLALADLLIIGTNISTITNNDGAFLLKVPENYLTKSVLISFLGYKKLEIPITEFKVKNTKIKLEQAATVLAQVDVTVPKNATTLVEKMLSLKEENYLNSKSIMTGFYRETIKNRNKNASLSEAVLKVYKQPYTSNKNDAIALVKARKNTNYTRLDTISLKLQGGPFSTLYTDLIKYPEFIFNEISIKHYQFSFNRATQINNSLVFVVDFKQNSNITSPLYYGKLFIDANTHALISASYNLNVTNREAASKLFVKKKPKKAVVYPTEAAYRVNYRIKDGKWHYSYGNILLSFKVKWKKRLFNSRYTLQSEMAITDWNISTKAFTKNKNLLKKNSVFTDEASGFLDPKFWGEYNIIEPEKSIENAIKKINKQLKKVK